MGNRWKRQQDVVCMYGTVNCAGTDGPLDAQAIIDAHNADCDAYEARIANLEADKNHLRLERNAERATCRRVLAELTSVKAESLRVVADGDACKIDSGIAFMHKGKPCFALGRWDDWYPFNVYDKQSGQWINKVTADTIVQPVRLERWEEQG